MATIVTDILCDLTQPVKVQYLHGNLFSQDNAANTINVHVHSAGVPESLGGTISANVIRSDGGTVAVAGSVSGDTATVVLPQACYAVPGVIHIIIKSTVSSVVTTIAAVVANVYTSSTDTVVDPGTIITDVAALIAQIEAAVDSIPVDYSGLLATIAADYSSSKTYPVVGTYAWQGGVLKRNIVPITTAESYTAAHWTNAVLGDDVSDLKSAINFNNGNTIIDLEKGYYIVCNQNTGATVDITSRSVSTSGLGCAVVSCSAGDVFTLNGTGGNTGRLWAFIDSSNNMLTKADASISVSNIEIVAPINAAKAIININGTAIKGRTIGNDVSDLNKKVECLNDVVLVEYDLSSETTIAYNIIPSNGKWAYNSTNYDTYYFEVPSGVKFARIKSNATNGTVYALLSSSDTHTLNTVPSYAIGCTRTFISAGNEVDFVVPSDCKYIWITKTLTGVDYSPQNLCFSKIIPLVDNTLTKSGEAADAKVVGDKIQKIVPLSMPFTSTDGKYVKYADGSLNTGADFAYTDYIDIDGVSQLIYSRVVVPAQYSPQHGIAFYDNSKVYISGVQSMKQGTVSRYEMYTIDVPNNAAFSAHFAPGEPSFFVLIIIYNS